MNAYRLTTLTRTDLPDAAALAAAAFSDTPCYNEILPDGDIIQRTAFLLGLGLVPGARLRKQVDFKSE